jgi:hypothetical protein
VECRAGEEALVLLFTARPGIAIVARPEPGQLRGLHGWWPGGLIDVLDAAATVLGSRSPKFNQLNLVGSGEGRRYADQ